MNDELEETVFSSSFRVHRSSFSPVATILLAAGRSRRMGAFKPLLPFGPKSVVETCVDNLLAASVAEIVVVVGHRAGDVRAALAGRPLKFAVNAEAGSEMGASIALGVGQLSAGASAVLVALADHPAVSPATIKLITEAHARGGARIVVPEWEGRGGHPVLVSLDFRAELSRLDEARGLRGLLAAHAGETLRLPVACPFVARDMDTWDDYRALHSEVFGTPPPAQRPDSAPSSD